jgi:hypothetical protein
VLKFNVDIEALTKDLKGFQLEVQQDLEKAVGDLAAMTHAHVAELAQQELHSTRKIYTDNLGFEEIAPGIWVVSVDQPALFIEEGIEAGMDMKPGLLKTGAKESKAGYKYKSIPFDHGKAPSQMTPYAQNVVGRIRAQLKKEGVPFKKLEMGPNGQPRLGKLHTFDFGGETPGKGNTPVLKNLSIYQHMGPKGKVSRSIMTFRTVSENPETAGKWTHPGLEPKHYLEKALEFAESTWENEILPEVLKKWE